MTCSGSFTCPLEGQTHGHQNLPELAAPMMLEPPRRRERIATAVLLVVGGLPLVIYPFVFFANMMSLAAETTGREPLLEKLVARAFLWSSLLYPLVYLWFRKAAQRKLKRGDDRAACIQSALPLAYLALVLLFFLLWMRGVFV